MFIGPKETADQQRALVKSFASEKKIKDDARARGEPQILRALELSLRASQQGRAEEDARRERRRRKGAVQRKTRQSVL
jgi:hypothetical protein